MRMNDQAVSMFLVGIACVIIAIAAVSWIAALAVFGVTLIVFGIVVYEKQPIHNEKKEPRP